MTLRSSLKIGNEYLAINWQHSQKSPWLEWVMQMTTGKKLQKYQAHLIQFLAFYIIKISVSC